ncbi:MAG: lamin tail domain-containing protein [Deltaproteobacteria bacterium]|nr:lamin tail domain-containing protein [Deltaproteobacteria bacterium]
MALLPGCVRDPAPALCPDVVKGELVITEFRGKPSPDDGTKPWVELYNASPGTVDLYGLRVRFRKATGAGENAIIVRRSVEVGAGEYVVLGLSVDENLPPYLDYGFASDYRESWLASSTVQLEACGVEIDRAAYTSLPNSGSYALGVNPPDAEANDNAAAWCNDLAPNGSPRAANRACP